MLYRDYEAPKEEPTGSRSIGPAVQMLLAIGQERARRARLQQQGANAAPGTKVTYGPDAQGYMVPSAMERQAPNALEQLLEQLQMEGMPSAGGAERGGSVNVGAVYEPGATAPRRSPIADRLMVDERGKPRLMTPAEYEKRTLESQKLKLEVAEKQQTVEKTTQETAARGQLVTDAAMDALSTIAQVEQGLKFFGSFGGVPSVPGTDRKVWETNVNKLLAGKVIEVMAKMKEASKTGATGFGQLSNKELELLKDASTALKRDIPEAEAAKLLTAMKRSLEKVLQEKGAVPQPQLTASDAKAKGAVSFNEDTGTYLDAQGNTIQ